MKLIPGKLYKIHPNKTFYPSLEAFERHREGHRIKPDSILLFLEEKLIQAEIEALYWFLTLDGQKVVTWHFDPTKDRSWFEEVKTTQ